MTTRRDFLKATITIAAGAGTVTSLPTAAAVSIPKESPKWRRRQIKPLESDEFFDFPDTPAQSQAYARKFAEAAAKRADDMVIAEFERSSRT